MDDIVTIKLKKLADKWKSKGDIYRHRAYIKAIDDYKYGRKLTDKMQNRINKILQSSQSSYMSKKIVKKNSDSKSGIQRKTIKKISNIYYQKVKGLVNKWEIVGSYRRGEKIMGDIDILIICDLRMVSSIIRNISRVDGYQYKLVSGKRKFSFVHFKNIQIDIRFFKLSEYPYAILYFTGNREFSIFLRRKAMSMGLRLNEYGLYYRNTGKKVKINNVSEKKILTYLNVDDKYSNPQNRTI
jgi:DNA polymerase/3'-5' exonuclease PolX